MGSRSDRKTLKIDRTQGKNNFFQLISRWQRGAIFCSVISDDMAMRGGEAAFMNSHSIRCYVMIVKEGCMVYHHTALGGTARLQAWKTAKNVNCRLSFNGLSGIQLNAFKGFCNSQLQPRSVESIGNESPPDIICGIPWRNNFI